MYVSSNIATLIKSRRLRMAGDLAKIGERGRAFQIFRMELTRKRALERPKLRWEDNIRLGIK